MVSPTPAVLALLAFVAAAVAALLWAHRRRSSRGVWLAKPAASIALVLLALALGAWGSGYGRAILAALGLSVVGDVLLIPTDPRALPAGVAAFLVAQLAYMAAFLVHGIRWNLAYGAALVFLPLAWLVGRRLLPHVELRLRGPVLGYILVVTAMVTLAAGAAAAGAPSVILAAALLFYASDLLVARDRFVHRAFANRLVGLPLYYAAQVGFAWSVAFAN